MQHDRTSRQGSPAIARPPIRPKCNGRRRHQLCRSPNERRRRTRTTDEAYTEAPYKRSYGCSRTALYNQRRPHSALGYLTPAAYAANLSATSRSATHPRPAQPIARCSIRAPRRKTRRGSNRRWMKVQLQVTSCKELSSVAKIENTLQQLANVLMLTARQDERLIAI